ncbi:MAG: alpha-isopropylmalate synthase regulatory domain-containing protein [SAR324 cluster bacterium]|nr:alpha-isopropylmalate synthase regulatory domain-containing protein [SAR324 cluster bacterium]
MEVKGNNYRGRAVSTDTIEASAKAYLNAINRVAIKHRKK